MNILSSLRSRIFLSSALLTILSIGAAIYLVSDRVTRELERSLERELASTGILVERLQSTRAQTFTTLARLIADAPKLKAAVDTNDPPTVQDTANDYRTELDFNLLLVTNSNGVVLASVGAPRASITAANESAVKSALAGHERVRFVAQSNGILHLVTVPISVGITQPDILGTLSVGFFLDDAFAQQLKQATGSDIVFSINRHMVAGTLPPEQRAVLEELGPSPSGSQHVELGDEEFVVLPLELSLKTSADEGPPPRVSAWILRSRSEQRRFLQGIHTELAVTALVAIVLGTVLSFTVARTITRPLAAITDTMRQVAATGDLTRKIVLRGQRWNDEDARLLATTFNTLTDSIARAQREMSQKERLSSLGRLSTVIAHEVRNPLMIIKAALHTLRRPGVDVAAVRDAAADIDGEVVRLNRIVNEVLDFARPIAFELAAVDLNALCRDAAAAAQAAPGPSIELTLTPGTLTVTTDAERLRAALVNLQTNARHAVDAGGGSHPRVRLATSRQESSVSILVADDGAGIDAADMSRIFDPYFTTKRGGTGLGLPIAKNVIDGLGGSMTVTSQRDHGTQILIQLPVDAVRGATPLRTATSDA
jgi:signal transduction histidine kinase